MKQLKRLCSFLIVCAMLFAQTAFAAEPAAEGAEETVTITADDALLVEKLEAFGAITNEYSDLGAYVTRKQMADIICKFMRLGSVGAPEGKSPFFDVAVTDESYAHIAALYDQGIITGDENLRFHPEENLTYDDALVFVINAIGYKFMAAREGGYPTGYHRIAIREEMLKDLKFQSGKEFIPLCDVYKLLEQALDAGAVQATNITGSDVDYTVSKTETVLSDWYKITKHTGIVTGNEFTYLNNPNSSLTDEQVAIDGVVYDTPGYTYTTSLGRAVYYYVAKDDELDHLAAYVEEIDRLNNVTTVDAEDLDPSKLTDNRIYYTDDNLKERHIKLADNIDVIYNNHCWRGYGKVANVLPTYGNITALDNTGDDVADILFVSDYRNVVAGTIDTYKDTVTAMFADSTGAYETLTLKADNATFYLMPDNAVIGLEDLQKWDVLTIMESKNAPVLYTVYVSRETVEGNIQEITSDGECFIEDTYYKVAPDFKGDTLQAGSNATFRLDYNGRIAAVDQSTVSATGDLAVLSGLDYEPGKMTSTPLLRLYTAEGSLITAPVHTTLRVDGVSYKTGDLKALDQALAAISRNAKDENGAFTVKTPYVVHYKMSGDAVSYLDTGKTGEEGKLHMFAEGNSFLSRNRGMLRAANNGASGDGTTIETYYKKGSAVIFTTPSADKLGDESGYSIRDSLEDSWYYRDSSVYGSAYTRHIDSYAMYNYTDDGIASAKVILLNGSAAGASGLSKDDSSFNILRKITGAIDAEGNATKKAYMNASTEMLFASTVSVQKGGTTTTDVPATEIDKHIHAGDTFQYGMDRDGNIEAINIIASYDATTNVPTKIYTDSYTPADSQKMKVFGKVLNVDVAENLVQVETAEGKKTLIPGGSRVVAYRADRNVATDESLNSIAVGDYIVARVTDYYNVQEIIVYKQ